MFINAWRKTCRKSEFGFITFFFFCVKWFFGLDENDIWHWIYRTPRLEQNISLDETTTPHHTSSSINLITSCTYYANNVCFIKVLFRHNNKIQVENYYCLFSAVYKMNILFYFYSLFIFLMFLFFWSNYWPSNYDFYVLK